MAPQRTPSRKNGDVEITQRPTTARINYQATPERRPQTPNFTPSMPLLRQTGKSNVSAARLGKQEHQSTKTNRGGGGDGDDAANEAQLNKGKRKHEELYMLSVVDAKEEQDQRDSKRAKAGESAARKQSTATRDQDKKASRKERSDKATSELAAWRAKYLKAFPTFTFYFDHIDNATQARLRKHLEQLGASVDQFFHAKVSHVVTTREQPGKLQLNKENAAPRLATPFKERGAVASKAKSHADAQDVLTKAAEFGVKVWSLEKLNTILDRLSERSPTRTLFRPVSLPSMLQKEQIYGTNERDPFAPNPDMQYFSSKSCFVLVEDTTGEHRPVCVKEFVKPKKGTSPPWPVLWGGIEGRTAFYHYTGPPIKHVRRIPPRNLRVAPVPKPSAVPARAVAPDLRRSLSLNAIKAQGKDGQKGTGVGRGEYLAASGNSQVITSNIASTTSAALSGAARPLKHSVTDKRIQALTKNIVESRFGQQQMGKLKRSASVDAGLSKRAPLLREEPKKPGYCENCRVRYEDFKDHILSRRHRKFACNDDNWLDLDELLSRVERPRIWMPLGLSEDEDNYDDVDDEEEEEEEAGSSEEEAVMADDSGWAEYVASDKAGDEDSNGAETDPRIQSAHEALARNGARDAQERRKQQRPSMLAATGARAS